MKVLVDHALNVPTGELPPKVLEQLLRALEFPNPEYAKRQRMGKWVGDVEETTRTYQLVHDDRLLILPRGAVGALKKLCAEAKITVEFEDARAVFPASPPPGSFDLRAYQEVAAARLAKVPQGILVMPCGAGKTVTALSLVARLGQPTLVLVHTKDLLTQWKTAVRQWLGFEPSEISSASKSGMETDRALLTIGMVPTISRLSDNAFVELMDDFGCVILDEAHHVSAFTFHRVVHHCHAKYRYGLTATPERADGLTPLLEHYLGPIIHQVSYEELLAGGHLTPPWVETLPTAFTYPYLDADDYSPMMDALVQDRPRNLHILARVLESIGPTDCGLVLSGRISHCELLCRAFNKKGLKAAVLHGKMPKKDRERVIAEARAGELRLLVATSVADEGLDIPNLSHAFLVFPTRSAARVIQRVGRVLRKFDGKETAWVHDFVDAEVPVLRRQASARAKLYRETFGVDPCASSGKMSPFSSDGPRISDRGGSA